MGFAAIAFFKPSVSTKSTYAKPFLLSISTIDTAPKVSIASLRRASVTPWEGLACLTKACVAPSDGTATAGGFRAIAAGAGFGCCVVGEDGPGRWLSGFLSRITGGTEAGVELELETLLLSISVEFPFARDFLSLAWLVLALGAVGTVWVCDDWGAGASFDSVVALSAAAALSAFRASAVSRLT
jgi:hypothetical protein